MIWIIGGTKDGRDILEKLVSVKNKKDILVSTATSYGGELLKKYTLDSKKNIQVICKKLGEEQMEKVITEKNINLVIDASHPYAANVSRSILKVTKKLRTKYLRFEREMLDYGDENVFKFETLSQMNEFISKYENKNILSTLGSNNLEEIKAMSKKNNLFVRILPTTASIQKAENLGYLPKNIIAIQGPVDKNLNLAMLKSFKIDFLITKESGKTGGEKEKIDACKEFGIVVLVLKRPFVNYRNVYSDIDKLINHI